MKIQRIKSRGVLFTYKTSGDWDLNIHLIMGNKYNYIIDTGLGSLSIAPVMEYIKHDDKAVIVVNTHYHWDHIWGNGLFKDNIVISHKLCREAIESNWDEMLKKHKQYCHGQVEKCLPNLVFDNELYFPEDGIKLIYAPGHTMDSISVIDEEDRLINAGDNIGDTVDEIVPSLSSEKEIYIDTLLKYKEMDADTFISGHNVVLKKEMIDTILNKL